jgi:ABC-type antimicrobial peptide transport system permease subunit
VLAAIGLYGVLAGSVAERIREIGLRSALGASRLGLLAMVMRSALTLVGVGLAIGLVVAAVSSRALTTLLFGVSRLDAVTYVGMVGVLIGVSIVAAWLPAWRAATVDPLVTLRGDN